MNINNEQIIFIILLVVLVFAIKKFEFKLPIFLQILTNFPGTFLHELAHFIVGLSLGAKPVKFSLFPQITESGIVYGYVQFANINNFNAAPLSMAPFSLYAIPVGILYYLDSHSFSLDVLALLSLISSLAVHSATPSSQDFKIMFSYFIGSFVWIGILVYFILQYFSIDITESYQVYLSAYLS